MLLTFYKCAKIQFEQLLQNPEKCKKKEKGKQEWRTGEAKRKLAKRIQNANPCDIRHPKEKKGKSLVHNGVPPLSDTASNSPISH